MPGRKRTPTAIKLLTGNPGKRRLNEREPVVQPGLPRAPLHLTPEAKREWRRMGNRLLVLGVMTDLDKAALAMYCQAWARWVEAEEMVTKYGIVLMAADGNLKTSPYLHAAHNAINQLIKLAAEFGMTPSSRSRIHAAPPAKDDPLDEFFGEA